MARSEAGLTAGSDVISRGVSSQRAHDVPEEDRFVPRRALCAVRVERIAAPSPARFQSEYVRASRPVVLRGVSDEWPARSWTLDQLSRDFGSASIPVLPARSGKVVADARLGLVRQSMRLGDYINSLREGHDDAGIMTARVEELPGAFRQAAPMPIYCQGARWQVIKCWLMPAGMVSDLHFDLADNLHTVLFGRKRFTLVAPRESACVYANGLADGIPNGARVDIEHPDFERFPRLVDAHPFVAELEPGDTLYIPRRWWHHGRTVELSLSMNHWWAKGAWAALVRAGDLFKRLRGVSR